MRLYKKIKSNFIIRKIGKKIVNSIIKKDYNYYSINGIEFNNVLYSSSNEFRLNLLIPSINNENLFGGSSTALNFIKDFSEYSKLKTRVIVTRSHPRNISIKNIKSKYKINDIIDLSNSIYEFIIQENDIFIVTFWTTAYSLLNLKEDYFSRFKKPLKLIYLIQDFEPGFYPWSTEYMLAESTYKYSDNIIPIFNSEILKDYFFNLGYKYKEYYFFEPYLNKELKQYLFINNKFERKNRIIIYGRPSTHRNAFEFIVMGLNEWYKNNKIAKDWEIVSAGEKFNDIYCPSGLKIKSLGKLSLKEYANLLLNSKIGISLMVSPHPSYPPMEMATFGLKVITNSFFNKDLSINFKNIYSLDILSFESFNNLLNNLITSNNNDLILNKNYIYRKDDDFNEIFRSLKLSYNFK